MAMRMHNGAMVIPAQDLGSHAVRRGFETYIVKQDGVVVGTIQRENGYAGWLAYRPCESQPMQGFYGDWRSATDALLGRNRIQSDTDNPNQKEPKP